MTEAQILQLAREGRLTKNVYPHCEEICLDGKPVLRIGKMKVRQEGSMIDGFRVTATQSVEVIK